MQLLGAKETDRGTIEVTFGTREGVHVLEGRAEEIGDLGARMQQASALGSAAVDDPAGTEPVWLPDVTVGCDVVTFGITGGGVRVRITRNVEHR